MVGSERLILRPYKKADFSVWLKERQGRKPSQNEFDRGQVSEKFLTEEKFHRVLRRLEKAAQKDLLFSFGIFHRETGESLGRLSFRITTRQSFQSANLGYEISNQYWGKGYAAEAVKAIIPVAFKNLQLHRVEVGVESHNLASLKVANKVGLKREGVRESCYFNGKCWVDLIYFRVIPEDFGFKATKPTIKPDLQDYLKR